MEKVPNSRIRQNSEKRESPLTQKGKEEPPMAAPMNELGPAATDDRCYKGGSLLFKKLSSPLVVFPRSSHGSPSFIGRRTPALFCSTVEEEQRRAFSHEKKNFRF